MKSLIKVDNKLIADLSKLSKLTDSTGKFPTMLNLSRVCFFANKPYVTEQFPEWSTDAKKSQVLKG